MKNREVVEKTWQAIRVSVSRNSNTSASRLALVAASNAKKPYAAAVEALLETE